MRAKSFAQIEKVVERKGLTNGIMNSYIVTLLGSHRMDTWRLGEWNGMSRYSKLCCNNGSHVNVTGTWNFFVRFIRQTLLFFKFFLLFFGISRQFFTIRGLTRWKGDFRVNEDRRDCAHAFSYRVRSLRMVKIVSVRNLLSLPACQTLARRI